MNQLREQLQVPLGNSGVDVAIRAGRYADIAQRFVESQFGPKIDEWATELENRDSFLWDTPQRHLERNLDDITKNHYDTEYVISEDRYSRIVERSAIVPTVIRPVGGTYKEHVLRQKGLLVTRYSDYDGQQHEWHNITGESPTEHAAAAVEALEKHYSLMDPSLLTPWSADMLTERTMHPIEMDEMGLLDPVRVGDKATISLDSAVRFLNGMRVYFDEQTQLLDSLYVPINGDELDKQGWEAKPEGRAFHWALEQSGIDQHLENAKTPVESSNGQKFNLDHDSTDMKYWHLAHGIVMRNTVHTPILGGSTTEFIKEEGKTPKPIHRELRAHFDVRTFSTLRASAIEATRRDACGTEQIEFAVDSFFEHLNANNRIDAQKLLGMVMGGVSLSAMFARHGSKLEQRADEYIELRDRMQEKLASVGVDKAESGVAIISF